MRNSGPVHFQAPVAQVYRCEFTSQPNTSDEKTPVQGKKNPGQLRIDIYLDNDNLLMGAWSNLPKTHDGNDSGYTHGFGTTATYVKGKNEFGLDFLSALYTKPIIEPYTHSRTITDFHTKVQTPLGSYERSHSDVPDGSMYTDVVRLTQDGASKESVRFVDLTRVMASWKRGETFYVKGALGYERRERTLEGSEKNMVSSTNTQKWWHEKVLKTYQFDYVSPEEQPAIIKMDAQTMTEHHESGDPATGLYNRQDYTQITTHETVVRPKIEQEKLKDRVSSRSVLASAAVGAKEVVFSGKCAVEAEAGGFLSTEDGQVVGPNSNIFLKTRTTGKLGHTKTGEPRFEPAIGSALFFYPTPGPVSATRFGVTPEIKVLSNHRISKNGTLLSPFMTLKIPYGRQMFEEFNDTDVIMRMGIRMTFR